MIIADSTPLINFAAIHRPDVLEQLFERIVIPEAVETKLLEKGKRYPSAKELKRANFIDVIRINDLALCNSLKIDLDRGEAEVITLALEQNAELLLLDEIAGRTVAKFHNIPFTGSIGCLVEAKRTEIIPEIKPFPDAIRLEARF
ncbi:MAG: DUF3368 domain-containing protein [Euryarchaeota archaeon]|nr:DUF3368 domain-containing protein [Euryarchaeota archaeon]